MTLLLLCGFAMAEDKVKIINKTSAKEREIIEDLNTVKTKYDNEVNKLIQFVKEHKNPEKDGVLDKSIMALGDIRAVKGIECLLDNFTMLPEAMENWHFHNRTEQNYPAVHSLVKIGLPSVRPLIKQKLEQGSELEKKLTLWALLEIQGKENTLLTLEFYFKKSKSDNAPQLLSECKVYLNGFVQAKHFPGLLNTKSGSYNKPWPKLKSTEK